MKTAHVGRYELRERIGEGGMGVVYRAYDPAPMDREVALKMLPPFADRSALDLFAKECQLLKSISHPNIVELFDMNVYDDKGLKKPFFVMPLLNGRTLDELIRNASHRLSVPRVVEIISQTCRGLQAAHDRRLVHRDLKPSNIFVMDDDSVKIIDFGVAHAIDTQSRSGFNKGTLLYMAPEQLQHRPVTPQSDIFSLGVVCYEALTRRQPFRLTTEEEIVKAILSYTPPPASEINPAVNDVISRVVHRAMAKTPRQRFESARELGETLQKALRNEPIDLFDPVKIRPRIERAQKAFDEGNDQLASEIVNDLEAGGHIDPEIMLLRTRIDQAMRQKTIARLIENARSMFDEDEDPLALQRIHEVLDLDPHNVHALALKSKIDERKGDRQIATWLLLARQHMDNHVYARAREAVDNVLNLRPAEDEASALLRELDAREREYLQRRKEKEEKHKAALNAWHNGELSVALSRMRRVLDLDLLAPETMSPAKGDSYQAFYNQVRTEHDQINATYDEARRYFVDRDFTRALDICRRTRDKYPGHALFQALQVDIEEHQRQALSTAIAEIDRRLEAEADLDARVTLLKETIVRYPDEIHFKRRLKLAEEKRDLVNSIKVRAQRHEQDGQFAEAVSDIETIQTIYPQFPGLKVDRERLQKRLEQKAVQAAKTAKSGQIYRQIELKNYTAALQLLDEAESDYGDDKEFLELRKIAEQAIQRTNDADRLLAEGQALVKRGKPDDAIQVFEAALKLDDRSSIRNVLRDLLVSQAQAALDADPMQAEGLAERALKLDTHNPLAHSLRMQALDRRRNEAVSEWASQIRRLQTEGDVHGAIDVIEKGLAVYPADAHLEALLETLKKDPSVRERIRQSDLQQLRELRQRAETASGDSALHALYEQSRTVASNLHLSEADTIAREIEKIVRERSGRGKPRRTALRRSMRTALAMPRAVWSRYAPRLQTSATTAWARPWLRWSLLAIPLLAIAVVIVTNRGAGEVPTTVVAPAPASIDFRTVPSGATIVVDGQPRGTSDLRLELPAGSHRIEATLDGYESVVREIQVDGSGAEPISITLSPLRPTLRVLTPDLDTGAVTIDAQPPSALQAGALTIETIPDGGHVLTIATPQVASRAVSVRFDTAGGAAPTITGLDVPDQRPLFAITTHRDGSHLRSNLRAEEVTVDGVAAGNLTAGGLALGALSPGVHELRLRTGRDVRTMSVTVGARASLDVILYSDRDVGSVLVLTNEDNARVLLNGREVSGRSLNGQLRLPNLETRRHTIQVLKEGFSPSDIQTLDVLKGQEAIARFSLAAVQQLAGLLLRAAPGTQVSLDGNLLGTVASDGTFQHQSISPGRRTLQLTATGFEPRRLVRDFAPGDTVTLGGADTDLARAEATLTVVVDATTEVSILRGDQNVRQLTGAGKVSLPEGQYTVSAQGPARVPTTTKVALTAGESRTIEIRNLIAGMELFDSPGSWTQASGWWTRRGGGVVLYNRTPATGKFVFTVKRPRERIPNPFSTGPRVRWVVGFVSLANYVSIEVDQRYFYRTSVVDGANLPTVRTEHNIATEDIHVTVDVLPTQLVHQLSTNGREWRIVDNWRPTASSDRPRANEGRFGFNLPSNDELRLANFLHYPQER